MSSPGGPQPQPVLLPIDVLFNKLKPCRANVQVYSDPQETSNEDDKLSSDNTVPDSAQATALYMQERSLSPGQIKAAARVMRQSRMFQQVNLFPILGGCASTSMPEPSRIWWATSLHRPSSIFTGIEPVMATNDVPKSGIPNPAAMGDLQHQRQANRQKSFQKKEDESEEDHQQEEPPGPTGTCPPPPPPPPSEEPLKPCPSPSLHFIYFTVRLERTLLGVIFISINEWRQTIGSLLDSFTRAYLSMHHESLNRGTLAIRRGTNSYWPESTTILGTGVQQNGLLWVVELPGTKDKKAEKVKTPNQPANVQQVECEKQIASSGFKHSTQQNQGGQETQIPTVRASPIQMVDSAVVADSDAELQGQIGISLDTKPFAFQGRVLNTPRQLCGTNRDKFFSVKSTPAKWSVFCFDSNIQQPQLQNFMKQMMDRAKQFGINFALPSPPAHMYGLVKYFCDQRFGIVSQCYNTEKMLDIPGGYFDNFLLKVNGKLRGLNALVDPATVKQLPFRMDRTMVVGIDVNHLSKTERISSSYVAAAVGSTDEVFSFYAASIRVQKKECD